MIARARVCFDEGYYKTYYADWLKYRSKSRKLGPAIAVLVLIAGAAGLALLPDYRLTGWVLTFIGSWELFRSLTHRRRWIKRRLGASSAESADFEIHQDRLEIRTPQSEGFYRWDAFQEVSKADHGVFLSPQKDSSFYIPWSSIEPASELDSVKDLISRRSSANQVG